MPVRTAFPTREEGHPLTDEAPSVASRAFTALNGFFVTPFPIFPLWAGSAPGTWRNRAPVDAGAGATG